MNRSKGWCVPKDLKELRGQMTDKWPNNKRIGYFDEDSDAERREGIWEGALGQGTANTRPGGKNRKEAALFCTPGA